MKKTFTASIKDNIENKKLQNTENENRSLRDKLSDRDNKILELKAVLSQKDNETLNKIELSINEVKLYKNIRKINKDDTSYLELIESIKNIGQLQPILLTSDNYLIAGERRFQAIKDLKQEKILVSKIEKSLSDIKESLILLQFSENEFRKGLDNFEIAEIFLDYSKKGFSNKKIGELFNKKDSFVSTILTLNSIDETLKTYIKEFQIYGYSFKKWHSLGKSDLEKDKFYQKNKSTFIGFKILYQIALEKNLDNQKALFLKLFKDRLNDKELEAEYFSNIKIESSAISKTLSSELEAAINSMKKRLDKVASKEFKESKKYKKILTLLGNLEKELYDIK